MATIGPRTLCLVSSGLCPDPGFQNQEPSTQSQGMVTYAWNPGLSIQAQLPVLITRTQDPALVPAARAAHHPAPPTQLTWQTPRGLGYCVLGQQGPAWCYVRLGTPQKSLVAMFKTSWNGSK